MDKKILKQLAKHLLGADLTVAGLQVLYAGFGRRCPVCGFRARRFLESGYRYKVLYELRVIGGIPRNADECPVCRANQRIRCLYVYLKECTKFFEGGERTLHVAPERAIMMKGRRLGVKTYVCGDAEPGRYDAFRSMMALNVEQLPFPDKSFDLVICSHVLEHVENDRRAMQELHRVLRPSTGRAILQVPIAHRLSVTRENAEAISLKERARHFGQPDHVRLYAAKDYVSRLSATGFRVEQFDPFRECPDDAYGFDLDPWEELFIAWRA